MVRAWVDGGTEALKPARPAADPPRVPANLAKLDDRELAALVAGGDRDGVAALHERYVGRVYDFVYRTLRSRAEARSVTRAVMVDALTDLLIHPEPPHGVRAAFCSTARARVVERLGPGLRRGETRAVGDAENEQAGLDQLGASWSAAGDGSASAEAAKTVWRNAAQLPLRHYIVLDLHLRQGLAGEALAEALGVSPPVAEHALIAAGRALLAASAPLPPAIEPAEASDDPNAAPPGGPPVDEDVVWQMLGGYVDPSEIARLDDAAEARLLGALAPVPMPVEVRNSIWRDLAARWPDPDEPHAPTEPRGPADPLAAPMARTPGAPVTPGPPAPPPESPTTPSDTAPLSLSAPFGSRPGDQLLARTRGATIRGDTEHSAYRGRVVDENALRPMKAPVRLRPRGDRGLSWLVGLVGLLFAAGLLVGVYVVRGPVLSVGGLIESVSLPELPALPRLGPGGETPTPPPPTATPADQPPTPTAPAASSAGAPPADTPAATPGADAAIPASPVDTPPPTATETATASPTSTATPTATETPPPPPPPTDTPAPPPPTATRALPTPTRTSTPRPPPPPPPPTATKPPPPTDTPAPPPTSTPNAPVLVPVQATPRR